MRFMDPFSVTCPKCSVASEHSVAALLSLETRCPHCSQVFRETGVRMREMIDQLGAVFRWSELCVECRDELNTDDLKDPRGDTESWTDLTLADFIEWAKTAAATETQRARFEDYALKAASKIAGREVDRSMLKLPLLESIRPTRWQGS